MKRSQIVTALAEVASQGTYKVDPAGARRMNAIFVAVAELINELEREEQEVSVGVDEAPATPVEENDSE